MNLDANRISPDQIVRLLARIFANMGQEKFIISILLALLVLSNDSLHIAPGVIASKTDGEVKLGDDSGSQGTG